MIRKILPIGFMLLLLSCKTKQGESNILQNQNTITQIIVKKDSIRSDIRLLQGVWAEGGEEENALFYIQGDTLIYVEHQENPIQIELKGDTLLLKGDVFVVCKLLKLTKDSLWYIDEFNRFPTKLYKRK